MPPSRPTITSTKNTNIPIVFPLDRASFFLGL